MSKLVKNLITTDLENRFTSLDSAVWVELMGVDGITTNEFRRALRAKHVRVEVVKNALFRRAAGKGPLSKLAEAIDGPAALVTGGETIIEVAKLLEEWEPKIKGLRMRGAVLEGEYIDESRIKGLSKMPTKRDLQGQVVGAIRSPGAKLAAAILGPGGAIAACLKTIVEKLEKGESFGVAVTTAPAASAAVESAPAEAEAAPAESAAPESGPAAEGSAEAPPA